MTAPADTRSAEPLVSVALTREQWRKAAAYLDWHGKDRDSELIVDAIREQANVE